MKSVLFVCVGNSCRSQMAEGFARHYGGGSLRVASAGLAAISTIAVPTIQVMFERGIDITNQFPKDFDVKQAADFDVVVNISGFELPPIERAFVTEWDIQDPYGEDISIHRQGRDEIERRVKVLVAELERDVPLTEYASVGERIALELTRRPRLWQKFTRWF